MANQLLNGEIITSMINEQMTGKEKLMGLAGNLGDLPNGIQQGDSYSVIKFNHLGEMVILSKGDTIPLEDIVATKTSETVEHFCKGFTIFDVEKECSIGGRSVLDLKVSDLADIRVRAIEKSLGRKLLNAPLQYVSNAMNESTLIDAMQVAFSDRQDYDSFAGIVINSFVAKDFYTMEGFVKADLTYTQAGNGIVKNGCIGYYRGIPVVMSDVCTYDPVDDMYVTYVIKKNSIGYQVQAGQVEISRNASKKSDEIYDDILFVTAITDDTGVLCIKTTK